MDSKSISDLDISDLARGYTHIHHQYTCIHCGKAFHEQEVYPVLDRFFTAQGAIAAHIRSAHGNAFMALLSMEDKITGLSPAQKCILKGLYEKASDTQLAKDLGNRTESTVRNHRHQLRQREREAKILLALLSHLPLHSSKQEDLHLNTIDQQFAITEADIERFIERYLKNGVLEKWPGKEKQRVILTAHAAKVFVPGQRYTEKEVNLLLMAITPDYYVNLRRYLVDYKFLERTSNGSAYWLHEKLDSN